MLIIHSWPMVSSHDFRVLPYVEESDWATCTVGSAVIGRRLCVVRSHWSVVTGLIEWALLVGAVACQSLVKAVLRVQLSRLLFQELKIHIVSQAVSQNETSVGDRSSLRITSLW